MLRERKVFLFEIQSAARKIQTFTNGITFDEYLHDDMRRLAVQHCFAIIGEVAARAARKGQGLEDLLPDARLMADFRNVLIHEYDRISDEVVWRAIQERIPLLLRDLEPLLGPYQENTDVEQ